MTVIQKDDFINSVANAFQFISYYHPKDFVDAVYEAWQKDYGAKPISPTPWDKF